MLPDYALSDITPNDITTLRLGRDPVIDALLDRIEELQDAVMEATDALGEAEGEARRLRAQLDHANDEIAALEYQIAAFTGGRLTVKQRPDTSTREGPAS